MKSHQFLKNAVLLGVLIGAVPAHAGQLVGNGGNGIIVGNEVYVVDLADAGLESIVYVPTTYGTTDQLVARIDRIFAPQAVPSQHIASKIRDIMSMDQGLGLALLRTLEAYNWVFLDAPLNDTQDDDTDVARVPGSHVQLASRGERTIRVNRPLWDRLNTTHQLALVIHEAVYAIIKPDQVASPVSGTGTFFKQSSRMTREIVAHLFSPKFLSGGRDRLLKVLYSVNASYAQQFYYLPLAKEAKELANGQMVRRGGVDHIRKVFTLSDIPGHCQHQPYEDGPLTFHISSSDEDRFELRFSDFQKPDGTMGSWLMPEWRGEAYYTPAGQYPWRWQYVWENVKAYGDCVKAMTWAVETYDKSWYEWK